MKPFGSVKTAFALFCLFPSLLTVITAAKASPDSPSLPKMIAPLESVEEKVQYLFWLRNTVPTLLNKSSRHKLNIFQALNFQNEVIEVLNQNPHYRELMDDRRYIEITAQNQDPGYSSESQISEESVKAWNQNLNQIRSLYTDPAQRDHYVLKKNELLPQPEKTFARLISSLPEPLKSRFPYSEPRLELKIKWLQRNYENPPSDLELLVKSLTQQQRVNTEILIASVLEKQLGTNTRITEETIHVLLDPDFWSLALAHHPLSQDAASETIKIIKKLRSWELHETLVSTKKARTLTFQELPPYISALGTSSLGGDCSSSTALPVPYYPDERVFLIKNSKGIPKGYFSGTIMDSAQGRTFYLQTVNGPSLSSIDVDLVIAALDQAKFFLKFDHVAVPNFEKVTHAYVNYPKIENRLKTLAHQGQRIDFRLRESEIRKTIEGFESPLNENMVRKFTQNKWGYLLPSSQLELLKKDIRVTFGPSTLQFDAQTRPLNQVQIMDALLLEIGLGGHFEETGLEELFSEYLDLDWRVFNQLWHDLQPHGQTQAQYRSTLLKTWTQALQEIGVTDFDVQNSRSLKQVYQHNLLGCSDAWGKDAEGTLALSKKLELPSEKIALMGQDLQILRSIIEHPGLKSIEQSLILEGILHPNHPHAQKMLSEWFVETRLEDPLLTDALKAYIQHAPENSLDILETALLANFETVSENEQWRVIQVLIKANMNAFSEKFLKKYYDRYVQRIPELFWESVGQSEFEVALKPLANMPFPVDSKLMGPIITHINQNIHFYTQGNDETWKLLKFMKYSAFDESIKEEHKKFWLEEMILNIPRHNPMSISREAIECRETLMRAEFFLSRLENPGTPPDCAKILRMVFGR